MRRKNRNAAVNHAVIQTLEARRLMSAGSLDPAFGAGGVAVAGSFGSGGSNVAVTTGDATVSLTNSDLLVAGTAETNGTTGVYIQRYYPDGTPDFSFAPHEGYQGGNGYVYLQGSEVVRGMQIDATGRIYLEVSDADYSSNTHAAFYRFNSNGTPDTTFGTAGEAALTNVFPSLHTTNIVFPQFAVDDKARIVISTENSIARFTAQGTADTTFGTGGVATVNVIPQSISFQSDGKILIGTTTAVGQVLVEPSVERLSSGGALDTSFGSHGIAVSHVPVPAVSPVNPLPLNDPVADTTAIAVMPNGDIAIAGMEANIGGGVHDLPEPQRLFAAEFTSTGAVVSTFGSNGAVLTDVDPATADGAKLVDPESIFPQADGSLFIAGSYDASASMNGVGPSELFITHYLSSGLADPGFGNAGTLLYVNNNAPGYPSDTPTMVGTDITFSVDDPAVGSSYPQFTLYKFMVTGQSFASVNSAGDLVVTGTAGNDTITVQFNIQQQDSGDTGSFIVTENGATTTFNAAGISGIIVTDGSGNDEVQVDGGETYDGHSVAPAPLNISIFGGDGNDSFYVNITDSGFTNSSSTGATSTSTIISAGDGNDLGVVNGGSTADVGFGNGNDSITTQAENDPLSVTMTAGNGNDTLTASSSNNQGQTVTMTAGTGQDTFINSDPDDHVTSNYGAVVYATSTLTGSITIPGVTGTVDVYIDTNKDGMYDLGDTGKAFTIGGDYSLSVPIANPGSGTVPTYRVGILPPTNEKVIQPAAGFYTESGNLTTGFDFVLGLAATPLTGTLAATTGSYQNQGNTAGKAVDGNLSTFFDAPTASGAYVGLNLNSPKLITQISYAPRSGFASRMVGGTFLASNDPTFKTGVVTLYTVTSTPTVGILTTVNITNAPYQYVRYVGPANSYCNIAEMQFFGLPALKQTGTVIGTSGSYQNQGNTLFNAEDGNLATFFDAPTASGAWVGLELPDAVPVLQVQFAPRSGFSSRMVGGEIQASTSANFSVGVVTLYTITTAPPTGTLTTVSLNTNGTAYQYYRYLGPTGSYCNIAELAFLD